MQGAYLLLSSTESLKTSTESAMQQAFQFLLNNEPIRQQGKMTDLNSDLIQGLLFSSNPTSSYRLQQFLSSLKQSKT